MQELTFLHFGVHPMLHRLPSLRRLRNLRSLTLAVVMSLEELLAFDGVEKLENLMVNVMSAIDSMPDMAPLTKLKSFVVSYRGTKCCSGFLGNELPASESFGQASEQGDTRSVREFSKTVCQDVHTALQSEDDFATEENVL
ncbi:hypothetical protein FI667_g7037, partial [Globisporangium splendens]